MTAEEKLQFLGVSPSHILNLKETKLIGEPEGYFPKKDIGKQIIPVSKILGLGLRGEPGFSWWEHFMLEKGKLYRIGKLVKRLGQLGINDFKATFMEDKFADDTNILYFPDLDLYITDCGSHRTVMAKVVNVDYMIAEVCEMERQKNFWMIQPFS